MCILSVTVLVIYDLSVLSMSVMGLKKSFGWVASISRTNVSV